MSSSIISSWGGRLTQSDSDYSGGEGASTFHHIFGALSTLLGMGVPSVAIQGRILRRGLMQADNIYDLGELSWARIRKSIIKVL